MQVQEGTVVTFHMDTKDARTGELLETSRVDVDDDGAECPGEPLVVLFRGEKDRLHDELEAALFHQEEGARVNCQVQTQPPDPDDVRSVDDADWPELAGLPSGEIVVCELDDGEPGAVVVCGPDPQKPGHTIVDFNGPLAGRLLAIEAEVVSVRRALPEETRAGQAFDGEDDE